MTVAEHIAGKFFNSGIRRVFGIPGGPSIPYMEAFRSAGIEFILTANEASAGIMADMSARLTGIPGVCHSTLGPGATNLSTGSAEAFLDRSAVIVLINEVEDTMIYRTTQMNVDQQKLFEPVTKATFRLNANNVDHVIDKALEICQEEYPGPVYIGLPSDIAETEYTVGTETSNIYKSKETTENNTDQIKRLLQSSRKPLIAAGLTSARFKIGGMLLEFLEKYRIPVVLTPMAKGLIPETHPCYAGVLFHALSDCLEDLYNDIDLVIGLGYDPVEFNYESWMPHVPLIHFNTVKTDMPQTISSCQYCGHTEEWFSILNFLRQDQIVFIGSAVQSVQNEMMSIFNGFTDHFGPVTVLKVLQEKLPENSIITFDVGSHVHLAGQYWKTFGRQNIFMTNGWSSMGFGLPASLAAKMINPYSTVVCVTGDGGFLMMAGEVITARRYNLNVIIVVLTDGELNLIKLKQKWQNKTPYATTLYSGDLFDSEKFFGLSVLSADSEDKMKEVLNEALSIEKPVIINARIDPDDYKWLVTKKQN